MSLKRKINKFRKLITKSIFVKRFTKTSESKNIVNIDEIQKILIVRPNHRLGNQLLITPLIQEVVEKFPNAKIDLFVKGNTEFSKLIFQGYSQINDIISLPKKPFKEIVNYCKTFIRVRKHKYDLVINSVGYSSSGNLMTKLSLSKYKIFGKVNPAEFPNYDDYLHNAKRPVYDFREGVKSFGLPTDENNIPKISLKLNTLEIQLGKAKLDEMVSDNKQTICIFTFATDEKKLSKNWWFSFYELLSENFENYNLIEILPVENVSQIDFKAPSFYSKDVREIAALIENTKLFIGADSGMMHLSNSTNTTTIGLFSVTKKELYQPYSNQSFGVDVNAVSQKEIIEKMKFILGENS